MENKEIGEINVIPLVDIMLVLLTIVLTTATFMVAGVISINLPEAKNADKSANNPIYITITKDNKIYLEDKEIAKEQLNMISIKLHPDNPIVIRADDAVSLKTFVFVLDYLKSSGMRNISMQVRNP